MQTNEYRKKNAIEHKKYSYDDNQTSINESNFDFE